MKIKKILNRGNSLYEGSEARENVVCLRSQKSEAECEGRRGDHGARLHVSSQHAPLRQSELFLFAKVNHHKKVHLLSKLWSRFQI